MNKIYTFPATSNSRYALHTTRNIFKSLNLKFSNFKFLNYFLLFCSSALLHLTVNAQSLIDINDAGSRNLQEQTSNDPAVREIFKEVDRYRQFDYNTQLLHLRANNIGDTLLLGFFDDKQYKATIQRVTVTEDRTSIAAEIVGHDFAFCYIVVSETAISFSAEIPVSDEYFFAVTKNEQGYIAQMPMSELNELPDTDAIVSVPKELEVSSWEPGGRGPNDDYDIHLLFVYTQKAATWASANATSIDYVIDQAMLRANQAMVNSGTGVTFKMVYKYQTDYVETNTSQDFYRLFEPDDGYMDEVWPLRDAFCADMVVFLAEIGYTGGSGWLLTNPNGFWNDRYAMSINRVQQSHTGYTVVHEMGHNMGAHHHAGQATQPGPNTDLPAPLNQCSAGWKGTVSGTPAKVCSIMTYEAASEYGESGNYTRIGYFSTPLKSYNGVVIGDATTMDNTRVLRETKTATAGYRPYPVGPTINTVPPELSFSNLPTNSSKLVSVGGLNLTGNISFSITGPNASAFTAVGAPWSVTQGGFVKVTFTGTPGQNYSATLTISGGGAASKTVPLVYTACSGEILVDESFDAVTYPPACWDEEFTSTTFKWSRVEQGTNPHPSLLPKSGAGMLRFYSNQSSTTDKKALIISPKINTNNNNSVLSFWMYRDHFNSTYGNERVNVYVSDTKSISGLTPVGTFYRYYAATTPWGTMNAWNFISVPLSTATKSAVYVIFEGVSDVLNEDFGANMYLDDIKIEVLIPELTATPTSIDFGEVNAGATSAPQSITVSGTNLTGNITWNLGGVDPEVFSVTPPSLPGTGGTFSVTFAPTVAGDYSASLTISSTGAANKTVALSGMGTVPNPCSPPGTGTQTDPYKICTAQDLADLATYVNAGNGNNTSGKFYKMMNDIDLIDYQAGTGWNPIGNNATANQFKGNFDGDGFVVKNLKINRSASYQGLFGYTNGAKIENLGVEDCTVWGASYTGGLVGSNNTTPINNCYVTGEVSFLTQTSSYLGGLVGQNGGSSPITNCYATCNVAGAGYVGGLAGSNGSAVSGSYATGNISMFAYNTGTTYNYGGLVGSNTASITNSYATGNLTSMVAATAFAESVGGLAGVNNNSISNCYATGNISGRISNNIGGLVGSNLGTISNSVAANNSISTTLTTTSINRIANASMYNNNYAFDGMLVNDNTVNSTNANSQSGADATMQQLKSFAFYNAGAPTWNAINPWSITQAQDNSKVWRICEHPVQLPWLQWQGEKECSIPTILVDPASLVFTNIGTKVPSPAQAITGSGESLTDIILYELDCPDASAFSITETSWNPVTGGTLSVLFTPTEGKTYQATIEFNSAGAETKSVTLTGTGIQPLNEIIVAKWNGYTPANPHEPIFLATGGSAANTGIAELKRDKDLGEHFAVYADGIPASAGWVEDATDKYWIATFSTVGFQNLTVTSRQRGSNEGPRDFALQYRVGSSDAWTTLDNLPQVTANYITTTKNLPVAMNNKAEVSLRWLRTSSTSVNNGTVTTNGNNRLDVTITGETYIPPTYTITPSAGPNGSIAPNTPQTVTAGENQTFYFFPDPGYEVDQLFIDGTLVYIGAGETEEYEFTNVNKNYTIHITFRETGFCFGGGTGGGNGTQARPFEICDAPTLAGLAAYVNNGNGNATQGKYYILTADIDLSGYPNWMPIGNNSTLSAASRFQGHFDGDGYMVKHLTIDRPTMGNTGLFGWVANATIQNVGVENADVEGNYNVGVLVGSVNSSTVNNCYAIGNVKGNYNVGGLAGDASGTPFTNSYSAGNVTGTTGGRIGGLVGSLYGGKLEDCYSTCNVSGVSTVGGIVGYSTNLVNRCYASGSVTATGLNSVVGGLVGDNGNVVQNSVAANSSITATQSTNSFNRIVGTNIGALANNYAFDGMTLTKAGEAFAPSTPAHNNAAGADKTIDDITALSFYGTGSNWYNNLEWSIGVGASPAATWDICDGKDLPYLTWQGDSDCDNVLIIATSGLNGDIAPKGHQYVALNGNKLFTFTPSAGYAIDKLLVNGIDKTDDLFGDTFTISNVTTAQTIHVTFQEIDTIYIVDANPNGINKFLWTELSAALTALENYGSVLHIGGATPTTFPVLITYVNKGYTLVGNAAKTYPVAIECKEDLMLVDFKSNVTTTYNRAIFISPAPNTLTLTVIGDCEINNYHHALENSGKDLIIGGTGTLTLTGGTRGIDLQGSTLIVNTDITVETSNSTGTNHGVFLNVANTYIAGGGTLNVTGTGDTGYGIFVYAGDLIFDGAVEVTVQGSGTGKAIAHNGAGAVVFNYITHSLTINNNKTENEILPCKKTGGIWSITTPGYISTGHGTLENINCTLPGVGGTITTTTTTIRLSVDIPGIEIQAGALATGTDGMAYTVALTATNSPNTWAVVSGALPTGLVLNNNGTITGTPTADGTFNFIITATNGAGTSAPVAYSITINPAIVDAAPPTITTQPLGATYNLNATANAMTVAATVGDGGTLSYQWYSNPSNSTTGSTPVGTNSPQYTPLTTTVGILFYYVVITNTNTGVNGNTTASVTSSIVMVEVFSFCGGSGTHSDPYLICTPKQLDNVRHVLDKNFKLNNDIDLTGYLAPGGEGWMPIGDAGELFAGSLNGAGYKITGLWIDRDGTDFVGLFGITHSGAIIDSLGVEIAIEGVKGGNYTGGLVGDSHGNITNCYVSGNVAGNAPVGGLAGWSGGVVSNCFATGDVYGNHNVGGLLGVNSNAVTNCYATVDVSGNNDIGGLMGTNIGTASNCFATGNVEGTAYSVGGFSGYNIGTISTSYATGNVNGPWWTGGLVGYNDNVVSDCYATGIVDGGGHIGGLVGVNNSGIISNCYATGTVPGASSQIGGLVGSNSSAISNCYYDIEASGQANGVGNGDDSGVTGKLTAEMQQQATFVGWDFDNIWKICKDETYPFFQWQTEIECTLIPLVDAQTPNITKHPVGGTFVIAPAGTTHEMSVTASVTDGGTLTYQWYSNTTASNTGGTAIPGETGTTFHAPIDVLGTFYYYVVVTNTNNDVTGNTTASRSSNVARVDVRVPLTPVIDIIDLPEIVRIEIPLILTGTVVPSYATHQDIIWSIVDAGTTGATITGDIFLAASAGTVRVRATIADGLAWGVPFIKEFDIVVISCPADYYDEVNDFTYHIEYVAGRCWMKENFRGTKYADGTNIPWAKPYTSTQYPDGALNTDYFGLLYTWYSAINDGSGRATYLQGICPDGWRIPTAEELQLLTAFDANELRNQNFWLKPNNNNNLLKFDARGAGFYNNATHRFEDLQGYTAYWSSDTPENNEISSICACIHYFCNLVEIVQIKKTDAISVRCVME